MKRTALAIIALLALGPCATADTFVDFVVTSGSISLPAGAVTLSGFTLSGDPFTATGSIHVSPCQLDFGPGEAITPCGREAAAGGDLFTGGLLITVDGVVQQIGLGNGDDFPLLFTAAPLFLSGPTQATLIEPVGVGLFGCYPLICVTGPFPGEVGVSFSIPGPELLTVDLVGDGSSYSVTSEVVTITAPEPGTILLLGAGFVGLGMVNRRRSEHNKLFN